ncbi:Metallo-dependent hydrolase [Clavulina sp. PMI_390]|nr:Metallo-dependent hydrolase [Clavulina sp. PMI_390]
MEDTMSYPPSFKHLTDVHCHPTASLADITDEEMSKLPLRVVAMSSRARDQSLVADLATKWPDKIVPCFGYHPWFTYTISLEDPAPSRTAHYASLFLPSASIEAAMADPDFARILPSLVDPIPLSQVLSSIRENFEKFPNAMLGEVGLDRAFRIPFSAFGSNRSPNPHAEPEPHPRLSPFHVPLEHQLAILEAQIDLAVECRRNISFHSVKAQAASVELLKNLEKKHGKEKWCTVSLDFHSCGLSAGMWGDIQKAHPNVFLSLSTAINLRLSGHVALIKTASPDRILVESDCLTIKACGPQTWDILKVVAELRGWRIEQTEADVLDASSDNAEAGEEGNGMGAVRRLMLNWELFVNGGHKPFPVRENGKARKRNKVPHEGKNLGEDNGTIETVVYE